MFYFYIFIAFFIFSVIFSTSFFFSLSFFGTKFNKISSKIFHSLPNIPCSYLFTKMPTPSALTIAFENLRKYFSFSPKKLEFTRNYHQSEKQADKVDGVNDVNANSTSKKYNLKNTTAKLFPVQRTHKKNV